MLEKQQYPCFYGEAASEFVLLQVYQRTEHTLCPCPKISMGKLDGANYDTWASHIKLWLKGEGYVDH